MKFFLQEIKFFTKLFVLSDEYASAEVVMAAQVLGGAIDDDIGAELERPLQDRTEKGVVYGKEDFVLLAELSQGSKV